MWSLGRDFARRILVCKVPKLFRLSSKPGRIVRDMKLNKTKVRYILRQNRKGAATEEIARDVKVCVILDDASRMVLAGWEFTEINTENSKLIIDQLVDKFRLLCPMRELILDHGSEF